MAMPSPAAPSAAMVTRSATARADQEFAVAVSAGDGRGHDADARPVQVAIEPLGDVGGGLLRQSRVAHDPALADLLPSDLELRLDQEDPPRPRRGQCQRRRQHEAERDEANVDDDRPDALADMVGGQLSRVDALAYGHAGIGREARVELAVADVDGIDAFRAAR